MSNLIGIEHCCVHNMYRQYAGSQWACTIVSSHGCTFWQADPCATLSLAGTGSHQMALSCSCQYSACFSNNNSAFVLTTHQPSGAESRAEAMRLGIQLGTAVLYHNGGS